MATDSAPAAILVEKHPDLPGAAVVRLNRPEVSNALRVQDIEALGRVFAELQFDAGVQTIFFTGQGKTFTGGADINDLNRLSGEGMLAYMDATSDILTRVLTMPKVVIALVNGASAGFGNHFAACADLCFIHESASFNFTGSAKAIPSMLIGASVMPLCIGMKHAKSLYLCGGRLSAERSVELGLANDSVANAAWAELPRSLAREFAGKAAITMAHNKLQVNQAALQLVGASRLSIMAGAMALSGRSDIPTGGVSSAQPRQLTPRQ